MTCKWDVMVGFIGAYNVDGNRCFEDFLYCTCEDSLWITKCGYWIVRSNGEVYKVKEGQNCSDLF